MFVADVCNTWKLFDKKKSILITSPQTHSNDMSTGSSGSSRQGTSSMSLNTNQDKIHHQVSDKRNHPSDVESYDDDDRLSVTAGHDFDVTADDEDELSLCSKEFEKEEGDTSEEGQLYESRYHDLLSLVEDDLGFPIEKQFAKFVTKSGVILKTMTNSRHNLKALLFLRIVLL